MESPAIATLIKMMETLPEAEQNQVVETVRSYIANLQDEAHWDQLFGQTQVKLRKAARRARREIKENRSEPLDLNRL